MPRRRRARKGDTPAIFRHIPHPVVLAGRAIAFFDRKLNREVRGEASRRERGIVTVIALVVLPVLATVTR